MKKHRLGLLMFPFLMSCAESQQALQARVDDYLKNYTAKYKDLSYAVAQAEWALNTKIVEGDSTNAVASRHAKQALAEFSGSTENITKAREFLRDRTLLSSLQVKQLNKILYLAADNPQTVPELVKQRIAAETAQTEKLFGFDFKIDGKSVTTNQIDEILRSSHQLEERLKAWHASKEVGKVLKDGLEHLQRLRNQTVQALNYPDYFSYQVSDYGMTTGEMMALMAQLNRELRPLYRELHTYARYTLAEKYRQPVPADLPAHWLPNRWGQDWSSMIEVEGFDLNGVLKSKSPEWIVQQAERFYVSLGFDSLPPSFWEKSSLYPLPPDAGYKKNNHASAWHLDLENDLRSLMSVEPNTEWYETTHHELGHIYYFMSYTNKDVPPLLREGANRAYHEAVGSLLGLASMQKPFVEAINLMPASNGKNDDVQTLLKEALNYIVFIPFSAGTMSQFEYELYAQNLPKDQYNSRWWEIVKKYQGLVPPEPRGEEYCDAATKTHINDDAAQYYDYALSYILLYQLHDHIATKILHQDPHATNYYGNTEVGNFLREILRPGSSRDWRELLREKTGEDLSANAMLRYFEPLTDYLKKANAGREHSLGEI